MRAVYAEQPKTHWPTEPQLITLDERGFSDTSWHNNAAPSFELGEDLGDESKYSVLLWTDAENPEDREDPGDSRYAVWTNDHDENRECVYAGDDFGRAVLEALYRWAKPFNEADYGTERQIEAENHFWIHAETQMSSEDFEACEEFNFKATFEEGAAFVFGRIDNPRFPKDRPFDNTDQVLAAKLKEAATAAHQISTFLRASVQSPISKQRGKHYREIARRLDLMREEHDALWERG